MWPEKKTVGCDADVRQPVYYSWQKKSGVILLMNIKKQRLLFYKKKLTSTNNVFMKIKLMAQLV